jgi:hypothetical protein
MNFSDLYSIAQLVKNPKIFPLKNFVKNTSQDTKTYHFFTGILSEKYTGDEDAAMEMYKSDPTDKRYMMLRINLAEELATALPLFDFSKRFSHHKWKSLEFRRMLLGIDILLSAGITTAAVWFAKRLLKSATEYEVTNVRLECLRILREDSLYGGNIAQMEAFTAELNNVIELYNEELKAEEVCQHIEIHLIKSTALQKELASRAFEHAEYLESIHGRISSSTLTLYRYRILLYALQCSSRYADAIDLCEKGKEFLVTRPLLNSKTRQLEFSMSAMNSSLALGRYNDAISYGLQCLGYYTRGGYNWFQVANSMFLYAMHTGDFDIAVDLYTQGVRTRGFENLPRFDRDKWQIYHAYLAIFLKMGVIQTSDRKIKKEFTITDLLDRLPEAVKDKKGLNIQIQIIHILYYLLKKDFVQLSAQIRMFDLYAQRMLKSEDHRRTVLFMQLLKVLRRNFYNVTKAEKAGASRYQELLLSPQKHELLPESSEILPYDKLWEWILRSGPKTDVQAPKKRGRPAKSKPAK